MWIEDIKIIKSNAIKLIKLNNRPQQPKQTTPNNKIKPSNLTPILNKTPTKNNIMLTIPNINNTNIIIETITNNKRIWRVSETNRKYATKINKIIIFKQIIRKM